MDQCLETVLGTNGGLGVGLSAVSEIGLAPSQRIPVPRNVFKFDGSNAQHLLVLGRFAYEKYSTINADNPMAAKSAALAYMTGNVALRDTPRAYPTTAAGIEALNWDSEVTVLDEDLPLPVPEDDPKILAQICPMTTEEMGAIGTLVVASKITWYATQHHLGIALGKSVGNRSYHGFMEKAANALDLAGLQFNSDPSRTRLYQIVHFWSTRSIMRTITRSADVMAVYAVPGLSSATSAFLPLRTSVDIEMRINTFGAGYAALGDIVAGLQLMSASGVFSLCPGFECIPALCDTYKVASANKLRYGLNAKYLTGRCEAERFIVDPFITLVSGIGTWITVFLQHSTLARAAVFDALVKNAYPPDDNWNNICRAYKAALGRDLTASAGLISALIEAGGAVTAPGIQPTALDSLAEAVPSFNRTKFQQYADAVAAFAAGPQPAATTSRKRALTPPTVVPTKITP